VKPTAKFLPFPNLPAWLPLGLAGAATAAILLHWIQLARFGFRPGDPILAIGDLPGVVYLLGGWSPGTSWYFAYQLKSHRYVEAVLGAVPEPVRRGSFLLFRENSPLWKGRREPILALAGRPESPVEEIGPVHFEEMTTRIFIWGPAEPSP
jgi:hypothetical protein